MPVIPKTFESVMKDRGLSKNQTANLCGIATNSIEKMIDGKKQPTKKQIVTISDRLAIPFYAIFSEKYRIPDSEIIDFRSKDQKPYQFGRSSKQIQKCIESKNFLSELHDRLDWSPPVELFASEPDANVEQYAASIAAVVGIDQLRQSSRDKTDFYNQFRIAVQNLGVFVFRNQYLEREVDGFAMYDRFARGNTIVVNSKHRNQGARTFTLAHELAHILGKRSAVSNNYESDNEIEHYCNRFAAFLLMPRAEFFDLVERRQLTFQTYNEALSSANTISRYFKTTISASLIQAYTFGLGDKNYISEFLQNINTADHPDSEQEHEIEIEGLPPGVNDRAALGIRSCEILTHALIEKRTNPIEICRRLRISKKV